MSDKTIRDGFALLGLSDKYFEQYDNGEKFGEKIARDCLEKNCNNCIAKDERNNQKGNAKHGNVGRNFKRI